MSRTRKLLASAGLAATLMTGSLAAAGAAGAVSPGSPPDQSPRATGGTSEDVRVVPDEGTGRLTGAAATSRAALACYDDQKPWDAGVQDTDGEARYVPGRDDVPDAAAGRVPVYVAESDCTDVNLRMTGGWSPNLRARVCFFPASAGYYCNDWTSIRSGDTGWYLVATGVRDGTRFEVELSDPAGYLRGATAY
jgi:hypothetical protein